MTAALVRCSCGQVTIAPSGGRNERTAYVALARGVTIAHSGGRNTTVYAPGQRQAPVTIAPSEGRNGASGVVERGAH